jgi:biopolymer transport protein ExbD
MSKFKKKSGNRQPGISTASLPDIVFMLLFFFMVTTVMREVDLLVEVATPSATEITKLENKALVSYIYIGKPMGALKKTLGEEPRIQLNDAFARATDITQWVEMEKNRRDEAEIPRITWSMKVDADTKMGIVTDVKQELRKANALKINYSTMETDKIVD